MATQVNGRVKLAQSDYDTYDHWRSYALSHGINFDGWYGNQCWDLPALLCWQYGLNLVTNPAGNGHAYQCWTVSRNTNARGPFIAIDGVQNIKRGDCLVFNKSSFSSNGHICFADTDYSGRYYRNGVWRLNCLGQNQGQGTGFGVPSNIIGVNLNTFLGIFRNTKWDGSTPIPSPSPDTPTSSLGDSNFPWHLYARKFRKRR